MKEVSAVPVKSIIHKEFSFVKRNLPNASRLFLLRVGVVPHERTCSSVASAKREAQATKRVPQMWGDGSSLYGSGLSGRSCLRSWLRVERNLDWEGGRRRKGGGV